MKKEYNKIYKCTECGKEYTGSETGDPEICMACWLASHTEEEINEILEKAVPPIDKKGAGGWDYYAEPNTIRLMNQADVSAYLAGCPKTRSIWFAVCHNSATPNGCGISIPRGFQAYHISKGWADIGYHWVIDTCGAIYLGRNLVYQGAHAFEEGNRGSMGWCFVGDFSGNGGLPSKEQISSANFLCYAHRGIFGYGVNYERGHRWTADPNIPSHSTSCPGTNFTSEQMLRNMITKGVQPPPIQKKEEDMIYGKDFMSADGTKFDYPNCWRDKFNYFVFTSGNWTDLKFVPIKEGETRDLKDIPATAPQTGNGLNKVHNMQDIMNQPQFTYIKGSYRLLVISSNPCQISLREAVKQ